MRSQYEQIERKKEKKIKQEEAAAAEMKRIEDKKKVATTPSPFLPPWAGRLSFHFLCFFPLFQAELQSYSAVMKTENMTSNAELYKGMSVEEAEDDFM